MLVINSKMETLCISGALWSFLDFPLDFLPCRLLRCFITAAAFECLKSALVCPSLQQLKWQHAVNVQYLVWQSHSIRQPPGLKETFISSCTACRLISVCEPTSCVWISLFSQRAVLYSHWLFFLLPFLTLWSSYTQKIMTKNEVSRCLGWECVLPIGATHSPLCFSQGSGS